MFNGNFHHPLDNLIKDDRLFMMEAILPFVDDRMKAPLAMYIKIMELQTILNALRDTNYVNSCGLHKDINNQDDILSSLAGCGFPDIRDQFASMKKAMDMMKTMEAMNTQQSTILCTGTIKAELPLKPRAKKTTTTLNPSHPRIYTAPSKTCLKNMIWRDIKHESSK